MTLQTNAKPIGSTIAISQISPNEEALSLLSPSFVIAQRLIPLGWDDGKLIIASSKILEKKLIEQLKRKTGWEVKTFLTTEHDIEQKLRQFYYPKTTQKKIRSHLEKIDLLRSLNKVTSDTLEKAIKQERTPHGIAWLEWLYNERKISEHLFLSIEATSIGYPHLRTLRFVGNPGLAQVIPERLANKHRIVPFYATASRIWAYTPHDNPAMDINGLLEHLGIEISPVLIHRSLWDKAYKKFYEFAQIEINFQERLEKTIIGSKYLSESQILEAQSQRSRSNLELSTVIQQRGWLNEKQWLEINSKNWDLQKGLPEDFISDADFLEEFPRSICQNWGVVPLYEKTGIYHVGISDIDNYRYIASIEAICNCQVKGHLLTQEQFNIYWRKYLSLKRSMTLDTLPPLGEWIVKGAYATSMQIDDARTYADEERIRLGESLIKHGWMVTLTLLK